MSIENQGGEGALPRPVAVDGDIGISTRAELAEVIERNNVELNGGQKRKLAGVLYMALSDLLSGRRPRNLVQVASSVAGNDRVTHYFMKEFPPTGTIKVALGCTPPDLQGEPEVEIMSFGLIFDRKHIRDGRVYTPRSAQTLRFRTSSVQKKFR